MVIYQGSVHKRNAAAVFVCASWLIYTFGYLNNHWLYCMYVCVCVGWVLLPAFVCLFFCFCWPCASVLTSHLWVLLPAFVYFPSIFVVTCSPDSHVTNYSRYLYLAFWHSHHWVFGLVFQSFSTLEFPFWSLHVFGPSWFSSWFVLLLAAWAMFSWHV